VARISSGAGSKQNYGTPPEFITPVRGRFGKIVFDLAAEEKNKKHHRYFAKPLKGQCKSKICTAVAHDSLAQDWAALTKKYGGLLWLNPPFKRLLAWVIKCKEEGQRGANVTMLSSAGVGSDWFLKHVFGIADVYLLNGRVTFDSDPFMRDLMITHWWPGMTGKMNVWDWRKDVMHRLPVSRVMEPESGIVTISYRVVVQHTMIDEYMQIVNQDGFKSLDDAQEYVRDFKLTDSTKSVKSQIIKKSLIEDVITENLVSEAA
jgi:hypothetical protein